MKLRRTLVQEAMVFLAAVVVVLSVGAFAISTRVIRSSLENLFRQRLEQAEVVLRQYTQANHLKRVSELEGVLTSPRLLAALETRDPATVQEEIPTYSTLVESDFVWITDARGNDLYTTQGLSRSVLDIVRDADDRVERPIGATTVVLREDVCELVGADIVANNGVQLGRIVVATSLPAVYAGDLHRLTGFDIVLVLDDVVVGRTSNRDLGAGTRKLIATSAGEIVRVSAGGEDFMVYRVEDALSGLSVVFAGSLDDTVSPMMTRVFGLLLALAVGGAAVAMVLVYVFVSRRIGQQVVRLVRSAERIARGDLEFTISPGSSDELGLLAGEFEKMRAQLLTNRDDLVRAHQDRVDSERMAALGQMATGIIHDFKNPMAVVQGTADLISARDPDDAKLAGQCEVIHRQVDRMVALARDVLEYANGRTVLDVETVEIASFLREIQEGHAEPCSRAGVGLRVEGPGDVRVLFDPYRMRRVVDNIVNNAREVSRVGDTVSVRWRRTHDAGVTIEIEDEGPGIPADLVDRIFDPFVTEGKEGGSGLGLAIARKIVEDHGATLEVVSREGGGAKFVIHLPARLRVDQHAEETVTQ